MRFWLLDRICAFEPNQELTAVKNVTLTEEYLADHFPEFPVLPGVFMLEAATQAAAWLVRLSSDYSHSIITLDEAKSLRFIDFVTPGKQLQIEVKQTKQEGPITSFKFRGEADGSLCVSGRLSVIAANLADDDPSQADHDARMIVAQRNQGKILLRELKASTSTTT